MKLNGYSGCTLQIITIDGINYVKKISAGKSYNSRLMAQKKKQERISISGFKTCSVISEGIDDGLYYFVMDYINGINLAEYISSVPLNDLDRYADVFMKNVKTGNENEAAIPVFREKIMSLNEKIGETSSVITKKTIEYLMDCPWQYVITSACHGDLTLQNIMVQNDELLLIDCLDSFYDSWMIDIAKVFQDTELLWSYRYQKNRDSNLLVRLSILEDLILTRLSDMQNGKQMIVAIYSILLLNILRIVPYSKDKFTDEYLEHQMLYLQDVINMRRNMI